VQITFLAPVQPGLCTGPAGSAGLIDELVWPAVREEYGRLRATPGVIAAALVAAGLGGLLARKRSQDRRTPRLLGKVQSRALRRRGRRAAILARAQAALRRR